jgi:hypothetical protein
MREIGRQRIDLLFRGARGPVPVTKAPVGRPTTIFRPAAYRPTVYQDLPPSPVPPEQKCRRVPATVAIVAD